MKDTVRVGCIGTGGIGRHHLSQLKRMEGVEIVALHDVSEEAVQSAAAEFGGRVYPDHRTLIEREDLDALYICVPPFAHTDAEILAAQKGIHLFVEKPVALTLEKALEIQEAISKAGVLSSVGYSLRYFPAVEPARAFLADHPIALVACDRWGGVPGGPTHWWRVMEKSGGQLVEMVTHQIDMIRYLAGEIVEVNARYALRVLGDLENLTVPDVQIMDFELESGAIGYLSCSCALTRGGGVGRMEFLLRDMILKFDFSRLVLSPEGIAELPPVPEAGPDIDQSFIAAVRTGDASLIKTSYADAVRSLDVTLAANRSAAEGRPVKPELVGK